VGKARLGRAAGVERNSSRLRESRFPAALRRFRTEAQMKGESTSCTARATQWEGSSEVVAHNVITDSDRTRNGNEKLDGRLAQAVMSIQAVKGVEIGAGITAAVSYGSEVMDEIGYDAGKQAFTRATNRAGGLEGGITNGEDVVVRGYLKPISTLRSRSRPRTW